MDIDKEIGNKLKTIRKQHNVTQEELAKAIGVTYQQIQKYEKGENRISCSTIVKCSRFLGIDVYYFFSEFSTNEPHVNLNSHISNIKNNSIQKYLKLLILELTQYPRKLF